jgi:hypothetical protein
MTIKRKKTRKKGKKLKNKGTPGEKISLHRRKFFCDVGVSSIWFLNALNLRRKKCTNKTKVPH